MAGTEPKKSDQDVDASQKRILLVDDDAEIIDALRFALEAQGYEILIARDGNQGLAMAEREDPDLVILDMMMPKRSGFLVLEKLRRTLGDERSDHAGQDIARSTRRKPGVATPENPQVTRRIRHHRTRALQHDRVLKAFSQGTYRGETIGFDLGNLGRQQARRLPWVRGQYRWASKPRDRAAELLIRG